MVDSLNKAHFYLLLKPYSLSSTGMHFASISVIVIYMPRLIITKTLQYRIFIILQLMIHTFNNYSFTIDAINK